MHFYQISRVAYWLTLSFLASVTTIAVVWCARLILAGSTTSHTLKSAEYDLPLLLALSLAAILPWWALAAVAVQAQCYHRRKRTDKQPER